MNKQHNKKWVTDHSDGNAWRGNKPRTLECRCGWQWGRWVPEPQLTGNLKQKALDAYDAHLGDQ